ncbi:Hsp20/alpha crystallin family protein [Candidatus Nitrosopelagicus sp.]|nr:Hsp20/alpha crystallin family protein [Candidatus Nitrosopelagicus sp.]
MSKYNAPTISDGKSLNYVIPIALLIFFGLIYAMTLRGDNAFVSFILIGIALVTIVYWTGVIKKMVVTNKPKFKARATESKDWVYDLIKGDQETVFVAEVPGPEDKIMVRLIDRVLYIRGSQGFSKEVPIEGSNEMQISDFKYRNGVLTLRIKSL